MNFTGTVKNGVIVPPRDVALREGAQMQVAPVELEPQDDAFLAAVKRTARPRPHWPGDYALNHGHYTAGEPRKPA